MPLKRRGSVRARLRVWLAERARRQTVREWRLGLRVRRDRESGGRFRRGRRGEKRAFESRLGPEQRAGRKIETGESARRRDLDSKGAPVKTAGDHEMENEPEVVLEADTDAFAEAAEVDDSFPKGAGERRSYGSEEKRADDADSVDGLAENARFERFDVNDDVGEFRHALSKQVLQIGAVTILHRRRIPVARAAQVEWWLPDVSTIGCGFGKKLGTDWPEGQAKIIRRDAVKRLHIQK